MLGGTVITRQFILLTQDVFYQGYEMVGITIKLMVDFLHIILPLNYAYGFQIASCTRT